MSLQLPRSMYIACRQFGVSRTLNEIAELTGPNRKEIGRSYRMIARGLGIHLPPVIAVDYVPRFVSELGLPPRIEIRRSEMLREAIKRVYALGGHRPPSRQQPSTSHPPCKALAAHRWRLRRWLALPRSWSGTGTGDR